jgi:hypothetical protein
LSVLLCLGCSFREKARECQSAADCGNNSECHEGFCVVADDFTRIEDGGSIGSKPDSSTAAGKNGGSGAAPSGGKGGNAAGKGGSGGAGQGGATTNPPPPKGGSGGAGTVAAGSGGASGMMADAGQSICEAEQTQDCTAPMTAVAMLGGCGPGKQKCVAGHWGDCMPVAMIKPEVCNNLDDDCNGQVDDVNIDCYPSNTAGCMSGADGTFACQGVCATGKLACANGQPGMCNGAKVPEKEQCVVTNGTTADEDCNGLANDGCKCTEDTTCYGGPGTEPGVGTCRKGMQVCTNGDLGACTGEVRSERETCANQGADNDCNGKVDDIAGLGSTCTAPGKMGLCAPGKLQCQTGSAALQCVSAVMATAESCNGLDDDCDGTVDDGFDLMTDKANCGRCGRACTGATASCCAGTCVDTNTDESNCMMCGTRCGAGSTCQSGMCSSVGGAGSGGGVGAGSGGAGSGVAGSGGVAGAVPLR